jgi:hypothetical protein
MQLQCWLEKWCDHRTWIWLMESLWRIQLRKDNNSHIRLSNSSLKIHKNLKGKLILLCKKRKNSRLRDLKSLRDLKIEGLQKTSKDIMRLRETSSNFTRLCDTSQDLKIFEKFYGTARDLKRLHETSRMKSLLFSSYYLHRDDYGLRWRYIRLIIQAKAILCKCIFKVRFLIS